MSQPNRNDWDRDRAISNLAAYYLLRQKEKEAERWKNETMEDINNRLTVVAIVFFILAVIAFVVHAWVVGIYSALIVIFNIIAVCKK